MDRETAIVEFFIARLEEEEAELHRLTSGALVQGYLRVYGDRLKANVQADRKLLERYAYCQDYYCPGNEDLGWAIREYEDYVFPARIARFSDHPVYVSLALNGRWVAEDYLAARDAAKNPGQEQKG
jgi:hypothetical protein